MERKKNQEFIVYANLKGYYVNSEGVAFTRNGRKISLQQSTRGYFCFSIRKGNETRPVVVHRLQAYQKYGEIIFDPKIAVRHLNGNRKDNSFKNIAIGTYSENMMDMPKEQRLSQSIKAARTRQDSIRSKDLRLKIYDELIKGTPYNEISKKHKVSKSTLSCMKNKSREYKEYKDALSLTINYSLMKRYS